MINPQISEKQQPGMPHVELLLDYGVELIDNLSRTSRASEAALISFVDELNSMISGLRALYKIISDDLQNQYTEDSAQLYHKCCVRSVDIQRNLLRLLRCEIEHVRQAPNH